MASESLCELMKIVLQDTNLKPDEKRLLIDELRKNNPSTADRWTYRCAIWILGAVVVTSVICICVMSAQGGEAPQALTAIGSAALGGLAGLLNPARASDSAS
ncbi:hypothetical protein GCM10027048_26080 [Hymenobacter coalescens]